MLSMDSDMHYLLRAVSWWEAHVRGDVEQGEVVKNYRVLPPQNIPAKERSYVTGEKNL